MVLDMSLVAPLAILTGIWLWQRRPWGTVISGIFLVKAIALMTGFLIADYYDWHLGKLTTQGATITFDLPTLAAQTSEKLPHRWIAVFLFFAGLSLVVWIMDIVGALTQGTVPANLDHYTTEAIYTLDLGVILPTAYLAGILVWRQKPLGTLLASILIIVNVTIGLVVASQSIVQALDGIILKPFEYVYVVHFVTLGLIAASLVITIFRNISEPASR